MEIIWKEYFQKNSCGLSLIGRRIHLNPVRAEIVLVASHYLYSSASNYVGKNNIFDGVVFMNNPIVDSVKNEWTKNIDNW